MRPEAEASGYLIVLRQRGCARRRLCGRLRVVALAWFIPPVRKVRVRMGHPSFGGGVENVLFGGFAVGVVGVFCFGFGGGLLGAHQGEEDYVADAAAAG